MDIVFTSLPDGTVRDYAMDLNSYEFSTRYQASAMEPVKRDGQTIYLPMPSSYYGFVVNKTLIDQLGQPSSHHGAGVSGPSSAGEGEGGRGRRPSWRISRPTLRS